MPESDRKGLLMRIRQLGRGASQQALQSRLLRNRFLGSHPHPSRGRAASSATFVFTVSVFLTGCGAPPEEGPARRPPVVALTIDGDGRGTGGFLGGAVKARAIAIDKDGNLVSDAEVPSPGTSQMVRSGGDALFTGSGGVWALQAAKEPTARADLSAGVPSQIFQIGASAVVFLNVGFTSPGRYTYRIVETRSGEQARSIDLPLTVQTVGQCVGRLFIIGTAEASDHEREPHRAVRLDPTTMTLSTVATWKPKTAERDVFTSTSPCNAKGQMSWITSRHTNAAGGDQITGYDLHTAGIDGGHSSIPVIPENPGQMPAMQPASRRASSIVGNDLYWIGESRDLDEHFLYRTTLADGRTHRVCSLVGPGVDPRAQMPAIDDGSVITMDRSAKDGGLMVTVRRVTDGRILWGPRAVNDVGAKAFQGAAPVTAVVLDEQVRAGTPVS